MENIVYNKISLLYMEKFEKMSLLTLMNCQIAYRVRFRNTHAQRASKCNTCCRAAAATIGSIARDDDGV